MSNREELLSRARKYTERSGLRLVDELGYGIHGIVFATEGQPAGGDQALRSAIKVYQREVDYRRKLDVYRRLQENQVSLIRACHVPQLLGHDDRSWMIEMTVVKPPFVLDFAGAYLDRAPDFSEEVLDDWTAEKQEQFGPAGPRCRPSFANSRGMAYFCSMSTRGTSPCRSESSPVLLAHGRDTESGSCHLFSGSSAVEQQKAIASRGCNRVNEMLLVHSWEPRACPAHRTGAMLSPSWRHGVMAVSGWCHCARKLRRGGRRWSNHHGNLS